MKTLILIFKIILISLSIHIILFEFGELFCFLIKDVYLGLEGEIIKYEPIEFIYLKIICERVIPISITLLFVTYIFTD